MTQKGTKDLSSLGLKRVYLCSKKLTGAQIFFFSKKNGVARLTTSSLGILGFDLFQGSCDGYGSQTRPKICRKQLSNFI